MKEKLTEDEELENDLELEMLTTAIAKRCSRLNCTFDDDDAKEDLKESFDDIKKGRLLMKKYEDCLKKVNIK